MELKIQVDNMQKHTAYLNKWFIHHIDENNYTLSGYISDDQAGRFRNKEFIRTSKILKIDFILSQAETLNTIYNLAIPANYAHLTGNS